MMDAQFDEAAGATERVSSPAFQKRSAFWMAIAIGAILRAYCVVFTNGTSDMEDWQDHAQQVLNRGLIGYYHGIRSPTIRLSSARSVL